MMIGRGMSASCALALVLAVAPPAAAESPRDSLGTCLERSGGVTVEILNCLAVEIEAQDRVLNVHYKALAATLTPQRREQLVALQRLWMRYRDANCRFYADPDGGTSVDLLASECVLRETQDRAQELANMRPGDP